jgi:tetratricopeptide (TPR) repeat protein
MAVIDLEEYQNRPDSVDIYVAKAMTLFEGKPELYIRKANRQYIKGDLHGAVSSFEEALTYAQNDTMRGEVWGFIGDTYHQIAEERALRDAEKKAHHEADSLTEAKRRLYPIRISEKKAMQRCYEAYEKSLSLHAENASVLNNYAYFLSEEHRDLERALTMSSQAIHLEQNNATFLDTYAWILHLLGRNEEAQTYMRRALSLDDTKSPELPLHYGDILYALGNKFMAKTYWQKALQLGADKGRIEQRMKLIE